ncbi:DUF6090 family protein [Robiginitalea sp. IMCC43444]|uniref:DUF6090 family protein n=1 Tax=Robiginitalea sp. IMCC43444 TaxID=3459121 RepID=UPI00404216DA
MLRFFRQIRQRLLSENKFSRYLLYAVGEVLLVVFGILIALQIDNWNEERKLRIEEQTLLSQLKEDYQANLEQLDSKIATRILIINSSKDLLGYFDHPEEANEDSVFSKLGNLGLTVSYDPIDNDLVATGKINLIQHPQLKSLLTKWSTDVIQVQEVEAIYINTQHYSSLPILNKIGVGRAVTKALYEKIDDLPTFLLNRKDFSVYDFRKSRLEPDFTEILQNSEVEGIVSNALLINEVVNSESYTLRKQILEILRLLEEQLAPSD